MKFTGAGQSYTFKAEGRDYPTPWETSSSWRTIGAKPWEVTSKADFLRESGRPIPTGDANPQGPGPPSDDRRWLAAVRAEVLGGVGPRVPLPRFLSTLGRHVQLGPPAVAMAEDFHFLRDAHRWAYQQEERRALWPAASSSDT